MDESNGPSDTLDFQAVPSGGGCVLVAQEVGGPTALTALLSEHDVVVVVGPRATADAIAARADAYLVLVELAGPVGATWHERIDRLVDASSTRAPVWVVAADDVPPPTAPLSRWFPKPIASANVAELADDLRRRACG